MGPPPGDRIAGSAHKEDFSHALPSVLFLFAWCLAVFALATSAYGKNLPSSFMAESNFADSGKVLFTEPSLWGRYHFYILGAVLFVLIETALIVVLLVEKRRGRRSQVLLARRFAIEQVISEYSTRLAECPSEEVEAECKHGLQAILNAEGLDRAAWADISEATKVLHCVYTTERADLEPDPAFCGQLALPWATGTLLRGQTVAIANVEDLPSEAQRDRQCFQKLNIKSAILTPANIGSRATSVLLLASQTEERRWPGILGTRLSVLANIFAGAMARKIAQESKRESEERFRYLFEEAPIGIGLEDLDGRLLFANPALCDMLEYEPDEIRGLNSSQFMDVEDREEDRKLFHEMRAGLLEGYQREMRFRRKDGTLIWGRYNASLLKGYSADLPLVMVMITDITERKAAEEKLWSAQKELQQLTARLIQAQEDERQRIARELHDDIGQRLSLLKIGMDIFAQELPLTLSKEHIQLSELLIEADELATDVHNLSHQLHSAKLKSLGLRAALKDLCSQVSRQHHVDVELSAEGIVSQMPEDIALCFYRVAQEALKNAVKHSGASKIVINVTELAGAIRMEIKDFGIGFDPDVAAFGLGLASMRERLRMVGGQLFIRSTPGRGAELIALVSNQMLGITRKAS